MAAAWGVFAGGPGIVVAIVVVVLPVGAIEEGFVLAVEALLFLTDEMLVLSEGLLVRGLRWFSLGL